MSVLCMNKWTNIELSKLIKTEFIRKVHNCGSRFYDNILNTKGNICTLPCTSCGCIQLSKLFRFFSQYLSYNLTIGSPGFEQRLLQIWCKSTLQKQHPFSRNLFYSDSISLVAPIQSDGRRLRFLKRNKVGI